MKRIIQLLFPLVERLLPRQAAELAVRLFTTPQRYTYNTEEIAFLKSLSAQKATYMGHEFIHYKKGCGPRVICLHGWSGSVVQFRKLADSLLKAGFEFNGIDTPGHGENKPATTDIYGFIAALRYSIHLSTEPLAVVGHSLGAATASLYLAEYGSVPKFVAMGPPVLAEEILQSFCEQIGASHDIADAIRNASLQTYNRSFESLTMQETFRHVKADTLVIHGLKDRAVSVSNARYLKSLNPAVRLIELEDCGHTRILYHPQSIREIIAFLEGAEG